MSSFRSILAGAKNIVVFSGAGVSAESGVPTFRGAGGLWRKFKVINPRHFLLLCYYNNYT